MPCFLYRPAHKQTTQSRTDDEHDVYSDQSPETCDDEAIHTTELQERDQERDLG